MNGSLLRQTRSLAPILALGVSLTIAIAGGVLIAKALADRRAREASIGGLSLRLEYGRWLVDQIDHGQTFTMPQSMMPDLPVHGVERFCAEFNLYNRSERRLSFSLAELVLQDHAGSVQTALAGDAASLSLKPGQTVNTVIYFDHDAREDDTRADTADVRAEESEWKDDLTLVWSREGTTVHFLIPQPPSRHDDGENLESIEKWPLLVADLPPGDPLSGESLYINKFGCVSCHGHRSVAGSATVGPDLGHTGRLSATRVAGKTASQYLYESILYPNAFIVADCPNGRPCGTPSAMPDFRLTLTIENMADLLAYLVGQRNFNGTLNISNSATTQEKKGKT